MNEYEVTFTNGEVVVVSAWTPEAARAIAEEDADLSGCGGLFAVSVILLACPSWSQLAPPLENDNRRHALPRSTAPNHPTSCEVP